MKFDAQANYDRMIPALMVLACKQIGLGNKLLDIMLEMLEKTQHTICAAFGDSEGYYKSDEEGHIFGMAKVVVDLQCFG